MNRSPVWPHLTSVDVLPTPYLAVDYARLIANIASMADRTRDLNGALRPHIKTHKSTQIAALQAEHGAIGATVATVSEARLAVDSGFTDVLVAYPPVPAMRARAIADLAESARVTVACSEPEQLDAVDALGIDLGFVWEIEVGTHRLGTMPGVASAEAIERTITGHRAEFRGLLAFAGHAYAATTPAELADVQVREEADLRATVAALHERGIQTAIRSVGTTPLSRVQSGYATEYRYGNYVFYDATQVALGIVDVDECAQAVITTVIGTPTTTAAVVDAGSKSLPAERMTSLTPDLGLVYGRPDIRVHKLYEEHGLLSSAEPHGLKLGDRLAIIPNHACTCANLHSEYVVMDDVDGTPERWPVRARHQ